MSVLATPERVLPTLNADGTRRWIRPRLFRGRFYYRRLLVAWLLVALFAGLPFVRIHGKPAILLDVHHRQFILFGATFLPTDGVLLMLLLLAIFVTVFLLTALLGRAWCGWACPQTVYMEFVFRPVERFIDGIGPRRGRTGKETTTQRLFKLGAFGVMSVVVANIFLAYFVGTETLLRWIFHSPFAEPTPFLVVFATSALVFFDFAYFREQMCTIVCPYARLQSVLLDTKSLVVAYDVNRGEPRGKRGTTTGDCVNCSACVVTCPTGIDIRNGLQLECITCTQCIDACDGIMDKLHRPRGLIRYTSQDALRIDRGGAQRLLRPRVVIYPVILAALVGALVWTASGRRSAEVSVLRGIGAPFVEQGSVIRNQLRIKIQNRENALRTYRVELVDPNGTELLAPENPMKVESGEHATEGVFLLAPRSAFTKGALEVRVHVTDDQGFDRIIPYRLLGPEGPS
jgi:cytochrome c oxidase accessory protein FixG